MKWASREYLSKRGIVLRSRATSVSHFVGDRFLALRSARSSFKTSSCPRQLWWMTRLPEAGTIEMVHVAAFAAFVDLPFKVDAAGATSAGTGATGEVSLQAPGVTPCLMASINV